MRIPLKKSSILGDAPQDKKQLGQLSYNLSGISAEEEYTSKLIASAEELYKLWKEFALTGKLARNKVLTKGEDPKIYNWDSEEDRLALIDELKKSDRFSTLPEELWNALKITPREEVLRFNSTEDNNLKISQSRSAGESLTAESSVEDFILEMAKNIAKFIIENRTAFAKDDTEAFNEFIKASTISDIEQQALEFIADPSLLQNEEEPLDSEEDLPELEDLPQDETDNEEDSLPVEQPKEDDQDMVPDDILKMLEE